MPSELLHAADKAEAVFSRKPLIPVTDETDPRERLVRGLEPAAVTNHDHGEFVTFAWVSPAWLKEAVVSGEIKDRVVVAAVAYLLLQGEL